MSSIYCVCGHLEGIHSPETICGYWIRDDHPYNKDLFCPCTGYRQDNLRYLEDKYKDNR